MRESEHRSVGEGLDTETEGGASTRAAAGAPAAATNPAHIQPLLLAAGIAAILPAVSDGGAAVAVIVVLAMLAAVSVVAWALLRRPTWSTSQRRRIGLSFAIVSVVCLALVLLTDGGRRPEVYFLAASALVCSLASIASPAVRWALQLLAVTAVGAATVAAQRELLEVVVSVALLTLVALLANLLAGELMAARRAEVGARADAERRTELLQAVRDLPGSSAQEAVEATVRTLRSLAFDAARVGVIRNGQLHEVGDGGWEATSAPVPRGEGLKWQAIEENRTVTSSDYQRDDARREVHQHVRSVVVAPIRVAGHPVGAVVGGRHEPGEPSRAEVEVAEVLAAHLGLVLDTETQVRRQRELLERMAELDHMRSGFVREVSGELRDPLTIVRTVGETLTRHGDAIEPSQRRMLLEQMCDHADDLRQTIDALLDFSRFQANRSEADPVVLPLTDLLAPVLRATGSSSAPPLSDLRELAVEVVADVVLVRHALEVLLVAGVTQVSEEPDATVLVDTTRDGHVHLSVVRQDGVVASTLVRSLVSQLLVAGGASLDDGVDPVVVLRAAPDELPDPPPEDSA